MVHAPPPPDRPGPDADSGAGADGRLDAGDFSSWLVEVQAAIRGERGAEVACGSCTACCTSSQFVHIAPDEADTLAHIPDELLFAAPGRPARHVLLGYDERGHCPMLVDDQCSIYDHRPRTCRTYDCRIFPASGLTEDGDQVRIARQAQRWEFAFPTPDDRSRRDAVRAAARFLLDEASRRPDRPGPSSATRLAVLAIEVHQAFLRPDGTGTLRVVDPDPEEVRVEVRRRRSQGGDGTGTVRPPSGA